jgi:YfiH family protein
VALTRRIFAHTLHRSPDDIRLMHQVHGVSVLRRHADTALDSPGTVPAVDAHFTSDQGPILVANVADCCPVIVVCRDPTLVGIAHAGWRGAAHGVVGKLLTACAEAGASEENLLAWVGPCAEVSRYEVGADTASFFESWPEAVLPHPTNPDKRLLNVRSVVTEQLLRFGVDPSNVTTSVGGTIGDRRYHSHRRSRFAAGRMAAFVTVG